MQSPESPTRPPRRPLPNWTTVLIPLLFAGGAALAHFQEPSTLNEQSIGGSLPEPTATSRLEPRTTSTPEPNAVTADHMGKEASFTMLVPGDDGMLHRRTVSYKIKPEDVSSVPANVEKMNIGRALTKLFQTAPEYFPKRTKVIGVEVPGVADKPIIVDLGEGFTDEEFWQGEETTGTALDAIVNTAVANSDSGQDTSSGKVLFHVDGKPLVTLGQMDMREPLAPNPDAVAKS